MARTSRRGQDVRMVAGTERMLAMETDLELLPSTRRSAEAGIGSKGSLPASYRRQASPLSSEASEDARARSSAAPPHAAPAVVLTCTLDPEAES
jgi:hypothetical protein